MKSITLRAGAPPSDDDVVIRSGLLEQRSNDDLRRSARTNRKEYGFWGLSVLVAPREDVNRLCRSDWRVADYSKVTLSTVGRIRRAGFPLFDTGDAPHFDIVLPDLDEMTIRRLRACFMPAQPNPPTKLPSPGDDRTIIEREDQA